MKQKIIGVTVYMDQGRVTIPGGVEYAVLRREYTRAIRAAGAQPIMLDPDTSPEFVAELCDGIVISGGFDIPPELYGGEFHESMQGKVEYPERIAWDRALINACDAADVPILGICYGMQLMNIHYGGTLYQDIPTQVSGAGRHDLDTPLNEHIVTFSDDFLGYKSGDTVPTAPRHHQAISRVADGWTVAGTAPDDIVEAIQNDRHFGVQWHAESDATAARIYGNFIAKCARKPIAEFSSV